MERGIRKIVGIVSLVLAGVLIAPRAGAGTTTAQLSVGITILDSCRLDQQAAGPLASVTGFGLKCSRGTDYAVQVTQGGERQSATNSKGQTTVTVSF